MIVLLEPRRAPGFVSGGYRYQAEIAQHLAQRGEGELRAIAADELGDVVTALRSAERAPTIVVDGLFVEHTRQALPNGVIALLHGVPSVSPWSSSPLPVIATSLPTADAVRADASAVVVVRPGLDACFVRRDGRSPGRARRVVCTGTICPGKGQLLVANALGAIADVRCELVLLGDGGTAPDYVAAVRAAAAAARMPLHVLGVVPPARVAAELQRADLLVSASRQESFGMAVAEGAACGVPVVAFATGEIASFVSDGQNGWLAPADASDAAFARLLHDVLRAPHRLDAARLAAVRPALDGWDQVAAAFSAACRELVR